MHQTCCESPDIGKYTNSRNQISNSAGVATAVFCIFVSQRLKTDESFYSCSLFWGHLLHHLRYASLRKASFFDAASTQRKKKVLSCSLASEKPAAKLLKPLTICLRASDFNPKTWKNVH